jgi:hypothetical protein
MICVLYPREIGDIFLSVLLYYWDGDITGMKKNVDNFVI